MNEQWNKQDPPPSAPSAHPPADRSSRPPLRRDGPGSRKRPKPAQDFLLGLLGSFLLIVTALGYGLIPPTAVWMTSPPALYLTGFVLFIGILAAIAARRQYIALGILASVLFILLAIGSCVFRLFFSVAGH